MANSSVHAPNCCRCSFTANECSSAVPTIHGIKEAFSTGSQNHHPPHPSSRYAHQLPKVMPNVRAHQAAKVHGRVHFAQAASTRPNQSAAIANA